jgi:hypothetical protein
MSTAWATPTAQYKLSPMGGDDDLRAAVTHLVTQYVWRLVQSERRPRALVVDEAHMITRRKATGDFLAGLTRRARKRWFRVTALTQDPTDFLATDAGRALLLNSPMALLLSSDKLAMDAIAAWETLSPAERDYLLRCARGQGLLLVQHPYAAGAWEDGRPHDHTREEDTKHQAVDKRLARQEGYILTDEMIKEEHERGSKVTRKGYQDIIAVVREGTIHAVLVFMFDRWGRDGVASART